MGGIEVIILFVTLLMAPFVALQAYMLVWILGPAIRRAGRRFAEGWFEVAERRGAPRVRFDEMPAQKAAGGERAAGAPAAAEIHTAWPPAAIPTGKYTITGRLIR